MRVVVDRATARVGGVIEQGRDGGFLMHVCRSVEEVMKEYRRVTSPAVAVGYHPAAGDSVSAGDDDDLLADAL